MLHETGPVYVVGCGDSYLGPLSMTYFCNRVTGRCWRVCEALDFSRYLLPDEFDGGTVLAISASGRSARVLEAASRARSAGAFVIAITANPSSSLTQHSHATAVLPCAAQDHFPTQTTLATMLMLGYIAAGGHSRSPDAVSLLREVPRLVTGALDRALPEIPAIASSVSSERDFYFVGAGPSYGTAALGMAKLKEAMGARAVALQLEEFNHVQDIALSARDVLCIIVPGPRTIDVAQGLVELAQQREAASIVVTTNQYVHAFVAARFVLSLPDCDELLSPLLVTPVLQAFAWHLSHSSEY